MLEALLQKIDSSPVLPEELLFGKALLLDLNAPEWADSAELLVDELIIKTQKMMRAEEAVIAIGAYGEDRAAIYARSKLFAEQEEPRTVHLGLDLTVPAGTAVFAPLSAVVHSFADNAGEGDYGPTVILQHELSGVVFYSLYGHLSRDSLSDLKEGQVLQAGEQFAVVGNSNENGSWPPHLHWQLIKNLQGCRGDYPGVAKRSEAEWFLQNCPNPNLLLRNK